MKPFRHTPQYLAWQQLRKSLLLGLTPALAIGGQAAFAQSGESLQLEEILVTATRRVTDVQTTPVAGGSVTIGLTSTPVFVEAAE